MTFQFSDAARNGAADGFETAIGTSPIMRLRSGAPPANVAAAATGTVIATLNLPSDWLAAASSGSKAKSGTWEDTSADAGGLIGHFEIVASNGTTRHNQGLVSEAWAQSKPYAVGQQVHANGNVYRATVAGTSAGTGTGPSNTSGTATDGGVTWQFVQVGTDMTVINTNVSAGQPVTINAYTITVGGA